MLRYPFYKLFLICSMVIALMLITRFPSFSQTQEGPDLGLSVAVSDNALIHTSRVVGAGSVDDLSTTKFGFYYRSVLSRRFGWESGLQYLKHSFSVTPAFTGTVQHSTPHDFRLLSLPLFGRYSFLKYFYVNGGILLDVDVKNSGGVNNQSGAGLAFGAGASYFFSNRIGVFLNPQIAEHSLFSFAGERNPRRLVESNITLGIAWQLGTGLR